MIRPRPRRLFAFAIITLCCASFSPYAPRGVAASDDVASAAGTAGAEWKASAPHAAVRNAAANPSVRAASTATTSPAVAPTTADARWRLPNASAQGGKANPLRKPAAEAFNTPEPKPFKPPLASAPLNSPGAAKNPPAAAVRKQVSSAVAQTSATIPRAKISRPLTNQPAGRPLANHHTGPRLHQNGTRQSYSARLWDSIQVAFEGPGEWTGEAENLPMPSSGGRRVPDSHPMHEGFVTGPDGHMEFNDGTFTPYGESAPGCSDGSCSGAPGGMCACGCGEAGCACEPGCACHSGETPCMVACGDDVCLVGEGDAEACHTIRIGIPKWQELMVFGGVHGYKGPYDQDRDSGNFGFHEGFNTGFKVPFTKMGYQIGYRATHSQLNGDKDEDIADPHTQQFITVGMFQRTKDGIQGGIAWDMLRDERFGAVDFHQLRSELSFIDRGCHEFGIAATVHLNEHEPFPATQNQSSILFQASDQYLLFYRIHGARGGEGRFYGGFNDDEDGIIGADLLLPLKDRWSLATGFTYLIPDESAGEDGATHESWNIGTALVWHWDCRARKSHSNCYRPMFNVADNGSLIVDERLGAPADGN